MAAVVAPVLAVVAPVFAPFVAPVFTAAEVVTFMPAAAVARVVRAGVMAIRDAITVTIPARVVDPVVAVGDAIAIGVPASRLCMAVDALFAMRAVQVYYSLDWGCRRDPNEGNMVEHAIRWGLTNLDFLEIP